MKKIFSGKLLVLFLVGLCFLSFVGQAIAADDKEALQGMTTAKAVFDVRKDEPKELLRALAAIRHTSERFRRQGVQPDFIVAFRGLSVVCLADMNGNPEVEEDEVKEKISWNIIELQKAGVQMEVCSLALKLTGMEDTGVLPGIKRVGNSLVSLIAYQNKGYAVVAI